MYSDSSRSFGLVYSLLQEMAQSYGAISSEASPSYAFAEPLSEDKLWKYKYHAAAIYLEQGTVAEAAYIYRIPSIRLVPSCLSACRSNRGNIDLQKFI